MTKTGRLPDRLGLLLTLAVFLTLLLPSLLQRGMFVDGVTYAAIARNMAFGEGSFWMPVYVTLPDSVFFDHPPLAFGLEALLFRLLGDHFLVERLYSFLTALLSALGIILIWNELPGREERRTDFWIPLLLWISLQTVSWCLKNNMLENSLGMFTLFASWAILKYYRRRNLAWLLAAAAMLLAAFGVKGPVGLFPLALPFLYWLSFRNIHVKRMLADTFLLLAATLILTAAVLIIWPGSRFLLSNYFDQQVLASLQSERELAPDRLYILGELFDQLIPLLVLTAVAIYLSRKAPEKMKPVFRTCLFLLLVGLAASLPLVISPKQRTFYLMPSMAWFALSAAFFLAPVLRPYINRPGRQTLRWLTGLTAVYLFGLLFFSIIKAGETVRDQELLEDVNEIVQALPPGSELSATSGLYLHWQMLAYLERYAGISLDTQKAEDFLISCKPTVSTVTFEGNTYVPDTLVFLHNYTLYRSLKTDN